MSEVAPVLRSVLLLCLEALIFACDDTPTEPSQTPVITGALGAGTEDVHLLPAGRITALRVTVDSIRPVLAEPLVDPGSLTLGIGVGSSSGGSCPVVKVLCGVARLAHYGRGEETLLDRSVRDTWDLPPDRVTAGDPARYAGARRRRRVDRLATGMLV